MDQKWRCTASWDEPGHQKTPEMSELEADKINMLWKFELLTPSDAQLELYEVDTWKLYKKFEKVYDFGDIGFTPCVFQWSAAYFSSLEIRTFNRVYETEGRL